MSKHQIFTEFQSGGDRVWLGRLGQITELQWSWTWPGGPEKASFKFWRDARFDHRALTQGRVVGIQVGAGRILSGILSRAGRGNPWECEVDGLAVVGDSYIADAPTSGNPFNLQEVVTNAISRGLPWQTPSGLPTGLGDVSGNGGDTQRLTVPAALSRVLPESGETWHVEPDGRIIVDTIPTTPTHLFLTADPARGRTVDGYVSAYLVVYNDKTSGAVETVWVRDTLAETLRPPVEEVLDLTSRGTMSSTTATTIGNAKLNLRGQRAPFASSFTFANGMIRTVYGSIVDPASLKLPMVGRLMLTDPDHIAETNFAAITDLLVRRITYYDDTDTVDLEPIDLRNGDFKSLLGNASAASTSSDGGGGRRSYGPYLEMTHSAAQATVNGATLTLAFDTDVVNTGGTGFHDPSGGVRANTDVVLPADGVYQVIEQVEFAANATGQRQANIFSSTDGNLAVENKNAAGTSTTKMTASTEHACHAGDVLTFGARPDGANPNVTTASYSPKVTVRWLRPLP